LDLALFTPGEKELSPNLFWLLEEIPGKVVARDMTDRLVEDGYWASYNVPFFEAISVASGTALACRVQSGTRKDEEENCWATASRAQIFRQRQGQLSTVEDVGALLYYNDWQNDPMSGKDSCKAIACRRDLEPNPRNRYPSGLIDAKVTSARRVAMVQSESKPFIKARLGPSNDLQPTFCWSGLTREYVHVGQPDCFDFAWTEFPPV
jgi:hypothetical protein